MTDLRKAAKNLIKIADDTPYGDFEMGLSKLRRALAQPEQKPVAWGMQRKDGVIIDVICPEEHAKEPGDYTIPLYTAPPKREWVGLTDVELPEGATYEFDRGVRWAEAKLKEKNT